MTAQQPQITEWICKGCDDTECHFTVDYNAQNIFPIKCPMNSSGYAPGWVRHPHRSERDKVLDELVKWLESERLRYDNELVRLAKFAPELRDKPLCVASDSSMCGQVLDKIAELRQAGES